MPRDNDGQSIAIGYRPGVPPRDEDFTSLRRDYVWRDPARLKEQKLTRRQLAAQREKLDAEASATPLPLHYVGKMGQWEEIEITQPSPSSSSSRSALKRIAALSELPPAPSSPPPKLPPSPSAAPAPTTHKRYLRHCPCEMCEARRAAG